MEDINSSHNPAATRSNRMVLLLIAGIPVTIILSATWLWYFVVNGNLDLVGALGTANRGTLVQPPRQIDDFALADASGSVLHYRELEPQWTLVVPGVGAVCDSICEHNLYLTRQIHLAMGKEFNRLRRMYVSESSPANIALAVTALSDGHPAPASFSELLAVEHGGLLPVVLEPGRSKELFAEFDAQPGTWYLVDPAGWVMMSYREEMTYKDVIADLKFLLKNSGD